MKFLVVGAWQWTWYQQAFSEALRSLGHEVRAFGWAERFLTGLHTELIPSPRNLSARIQQRLGWGPLVNELNRDLVQAAREFQPNVLFAYNGTLVRPEALRRIKNALPETLLVQYSNDNPFSANADWFLWRHLKRSIPIYEAHFVYRHGNELDLRQHGGRNIRLLRSYYVPETDFRAEPTENETDFRSDVLFAGHYEPDGRLEMLEEVAGLDVNFKLFGGTWQLAEDRLRPNGRLRALFPVRALSRADYRKAISGTKIALCFLSKLNGDTYTRRSFEIPAMQTFMLSEYTEDLASLYREGSEAEFFRSKEEMLDKIVYYLKHDDERQSIAANGHRRLLRDGHDVVARARQFVADLEAQGARANKPMEDAHYLQRSSTGSGG
jgi:hypothetical protein